ncbi:MAG: NfeD family protein [Brevinematales bacterium]
MPYYVWFAISAILIALEIVMPGFVIFWFGIGAFLTAFISLFKLIRDVEFQFLFFFVSSTIFLLIWFFWIKKYFVKEKPLDIDDPSLAEAKGRVIKEIKPGVPGEVELYDIYHGSKKWKAKSDEEIEIGDEVFVKKVDGIALIVGKLKNRRK